MQKLITIALLQTFGRSSVISSCSNKPPSITTFSPDDFAGLWQLSYATLYRDDRLGCATWQVSKPNSKAKLETTFFKNTIFSWNYLNSGESQARRRTLSYSPDGILSSSYLFDLVKIEHERIILTDYTTYAVAYSCRTDPYVESFLDGQKD